MKNCLIVLNNKKNILDYINNDKIMWKYVCRELIIKIEYYNWTILLVLLINLFDYI